LAGPISQGRNTLKLKPDPDDPRRPLPLNYDDRCTWSVVLIVVAALALFVTAFFVFKTGGATQLKTSTPLAAKSQ
jgi:hypothetical protein